MADEAESYLERIGRRFYQTSPRNSKNPSVCLWLKTRRVELDFSDSLVRLSFCSLDVSAVYLVKPPS